MKLDRCRIFHNPKRDAVMIVHQNTGSDGLLVAVDRTADAAQAISGWVLQESWDGHAQLPVVMGWFKRFWAWATRAKSVHVATGWRDAELLRGKHIRIKVDIYQKRGS